MHKDNLGSKKGVFDPSWRVWLGIFDFSCEKTMVSETNANSSPTTPKTAIAGL